MIKFLLLAIFSLVVLTASRAAAQSDDFRQLPQPDVKGGMPLMQALNERKSERTFSEKPLSDETLGNLLWASFGVNRPDGKRTAPTALNVRDIDIYVLTPDGAWLYDAARHGLRKVSPADARQFLGPQDFARTAPVTFVYATNRKRDPRYTDMHVGSVYQNAGLYCASVGLNNVVRASIDKKALEQALGLADGREVIITQTFGWGE